MDGDEDESPDCRCAMCDIEFSSPIIKKRKKDGIGFYCPLGHSNYYRDARDEVEEEERIRLEARTINEVSSRIVTSITEESDEAPTRWKRLRGRRGSK